METGDKKKFGGGWWDRRLFEKVGERGPSLPRNTNTEEAIDMAKRGEQQQLR